MAFQGGQSPEVAYGNGQGEGDKQVIPFTDTAKEVVTTNGYPPAHHNGYGQQSFYQATSEQQHRTKRRTWLLFGVAILVAILAGVAGGVTGWKVTEARQVQSCAPGAETPDSGKGGGGGNSPLPPSVCPTSQNETAGVKRTIREHSGLAVAGHQYDNDFTIRLFYQAPDDTIMFSSYIAMYGRWTAPRAVKASTQVMGGTPMAAAVIYFQYAQPGAPATPQTQLYFLSPEGRLVGHNWRDFTPLGGADSINTKSFMASRTTSLSALWPYVQYVSDQGNLSEVWWSSSGRAFPNFTSSDLDTGTGTRAGASSHLALPGMLDRGPNENEVRFFFRDREGRIRLHTRAPDNGVVTASSGSLDVAIPEGAALAGFTYGRRDGSLNTLLLFQDVGRANDNGGIVILSQMDGSTGTKFSAPTSDPVFASADVPTSITCLTKGPGVTYDNNAYVSMALSTKTDLNRCYFQSDKGKIKEVLWDGTKWTDLGHLPMP